MQHQNAATTPNDVKLSKEAAAEIYASRYATTIKHFEMLERGQEQQLARRWQQHGDRRATDALITSHLRLAAKVARRYQGYGLPIADLVAEANLGLVMAAARFEPDRGARFSTYALWWIKAAIHEYILRSWSLVKIGTTAAQKKLFFGLRREMRKLGADMVALTPETAEAVARELEVTPREVIEMDTRLSGDLSLNAPICDDGNTTEWESMLADDAPNPEAVVAEHDENSQRATAVDAALKVLSARERHIFEARRLAEDPPSLEQLGHELSISSERVRQIEISAFAKVKRAATGYLQKDRSSLDRVQLALAE
jgi:RNA polymerase sigma-32 factor